MDDLHSAYSHTGCCYWTLVQILFHHFSLLPTNFHTTHLLVSVSNHSQCLTHSFWVKGHFLTTLIFCCPLSSIHLLNLHSLPLLTIQGSSRCLHSITFTFLHQTWSSSLIRQCHMRLMNCTEDCFFSQSVPTCQLMTSSLLSLCPCTSNHRRCSGQRIFYSQNCIFVICNTVQFLSMYLYKLCR